MLKLKNSAMLVVAVLCGYLALMTPDWKSDLVASSGQAYLGFRSNFDSVAGGTDDITLSGSTQQIWTTAGYSIANYIDLGQTPNGGTAVLKATPDSNGDGLNDMIFQDAGGNIFSWVLANNGTTYTGYYLTTTTGVVVASGDFDGDHDGDIVLQDPSTGDISIILLQNGVNVAFNWLGTFSAYSIKAVGDVDGDTIDDIVTESAAYDIGTMTITSSGTLKAAGWQEQWPGRIVIGTGDSNGDGHEDIFTDTTQPVTGLGIITMFNGQYQTGSWVGDFYGYTVRGLGDVDKDGITDFIVEDAIGNMGSVTTINNGVKAATWLAQIPYTIKGALDTDGDNDADLVMQDGAGNVGIMQMENGVNGITAWVGASALSVKVFRKVGP